MLGPGQIESLKTSVDLVGVIESCGIALKRSGKSYKGFCPFHEDTKTPSLSVPPEKHLWQCFGCGAGGDVIDFLRKKEGLSFSRVDLLERSESGHCPVSPSIFPLPATNSGQR